MKYRIIAILIALAWLSPCCAQPYCDVRTFTIRDGLAANTISGFKQDGDGLMWFSTWNGLCFYDGYRFTTFRNSPGAGEVLTTNRIMLIKPSVTGNIWFCTSDRHIYLFDTKECRFANVNGMIRERFGRDISVRNIYTLANGHTWIISYDGNASYRVDDNKILDGEGIEQFSVSKGNLMSNNLKKVKLDDDGNEWIFGDNGIVRLKGKFSCKVPFEYMLQTKSHLFFVSPDGRVFSYGKTTEKMKPVAMPKGVIRINHAIKQNDNRLFFATNEGIVSYDIAHQTAKVTSVQTPGQPSSEVTNLYIDKRQRIWAFTKSSGIVMIREAKDNAPLWLMAKADNPIHQTTCESPFIHEDEYGTIWVVPTDGTFSYYDDAEERLVPYLLKSNGLSDTYLPTITKFAFDREKNLWFTGTRDVNFVNFRYHHFKLTSVLPNQEVRSLLIDRSGRTWAGTYNGQLALFDAGRRLIGYMDKQGRIQSEKTDFSNRIYALYEDKRGRIWIGTKGNGLYVIGEDGEVRQYKNNPADKYSLSYNDIYDIDVDNRGHIWVGSYDGGLNLVEERGGSLRFINHYNTLSQYPMTSYGRIRRITHTDGVVILSTTNGLLTFSDRFESPADIRFHVTGHIVGDTTSLMAPDVLQTLVASTGNIYVATLGGGIQQLASKQLLHDSLRFCDLPNVKPDDGIVQSVAEDNKGNLWIIRESSIDQYNLSTGKLFQYGPGNIGDGIELSEAKPAHDANTDFISVAARGGYVSFNSKDLKKSNYSPNIVFTSVLYHGSSKMVPILNRDILDVPSDSRNLTIYFSALEYSDKYLVRYAYKIEGVDETWNYVGSSNSASFNRLPAGHYRLLVKSTNSDGVWVDNVAGLNIYAHPTFWETGWAWMLYFLLACGIIYVAIYIYMLRTKALLERDLNDMKTKFFTEISHKLRTPLTLIGGPITEVLNSGSVTEVARRHLEMVQRNAFHMLELVNKMLKYSMDHGTYISDDNAKEQLRADAPDPIANVYEHCNKNVRLLVVEDNDDLRAFLVSILSKDYIILQAENGQRGLEMAETQMPDFIITDVMMPVMDGLTMVHRIKQNNDICHIPIVVLSAKASLEDRLQGLEEGIDDYITKPFSAMYLKSRVSNIISQRRMLQQTYVEQINTEDRRTYKLEAPQIVDSDNEMMKKLLGYLEEHVSDPSLKIEDLAEAVNLGRSVFYGKIKSIVGMTPVDFLRRIRIQRAEELITKSDYSFSQIAYSVGFSDPKYFGKCFKKETGMTPSEYREKSEQGTSE